MAILRMVLPRSISRRVAPLGCAAVMLGSLTTSAALAQVVDVQAGGTAVQVDRTDGQAAAPRDSQVIQNDRQRPRSGENMERQIADWLMVDQQQMVNLAKFGMQKTQSPKVRELAQTIVSDHEAFARKLADAGSRGSDARRSADASDEPRDPSREAARDARRTADPDSDQGQGQGQDQDQERSGERRPLENLGARLDEGVERLADRAERVVGDAREGLGRAVDGERPNRSPRGLRWVEIHREIAQKLEDAARQDLEKRQGYEFDAAFVGMLVAAHLQQEATLDVLSSRATGDLAETLNQALASVKQHRQAAEQVMGQIKP